MQLFTEIIKTEKYLQKLLKCQAGRLGCREQRPVDLLKVGGSASALRDNTLIKVENVL